MFNFRQLKNRNYPGYAARIAPWVYASQCLIAFIIGIISGADILLALTFIAFIEAIGSYLFFRAFSYSIRKPDYVFNYGYGKYESMNNFVSTIIYTVSLALMFYLAFSFTEIEKNGIALTFAAPFTALIICLSSLRLFILQKRYYIRYNIQNLKSNYKHIKIKTLIEFIAFTALLLNSVLIFSGSPFYADLIDSVISIIIIVLMMQFPLIEFKNSVKQLLDKNLPEHIQYDLIAVIAEHLNKMCKFQTMHTRQSGKDLFIEIDIVLPWDYTIEQKYDLEKEIKSAILQKLPHSIIRLYVLPCDKDCFGEDGYKNCPVKRNKKND